jgi:DNA damage-binding protein 1
MKSLSIIEASINSSSHTLREVSRHFATVWSSACSVISDNHWLLADMEGNLATLRRDPTGPTADDRRRLQLTGEFRLGEVVNKIVPIANPITPTSNSTNSKGKERSRALSSSATQPTLTSKHDSSTTKLPRVGPLITPQAFLGTVEGSIYLHGSINPAYLDVLLRLQRPLANRVAAPGHMPWANYRAWKTLVREAEEPFRFVDGEVMEAGLLRLDDKVLEEVLQEAGLSGGADDEQSGVEGFGVTVEEVRGWGEELRRLY